LARAASVGEIADRLEITQDSVRFRPSSVMHKLDAQTQTEAVEIAKRKDGCRYFKPGIVAF
jgi:DNA-binding CsgD family transcriptional regulator